jgi:Putative zinc-finger
MMERCLTEGTIQAFLDGELRAEALDEVTRHIALCDSCAIALSEAEDETAVAFAALEQEYNALVPTQRLWVKINSSIEEERRSNSFWQKVLAGVSSFGFQLSKPSVAAFASLLLVVGTFSALWLSRPVPNNNVVSVDDGSNGVIEIAQTPFSAPPNVANPDSGKQIEDVASDTPNNVDEPRIVKADNRRIIENYSDNTKINNPNINRKSPAGEQKPTITTLQYIPGEENYTKTIATLKTTVDGEKDLNLRPSERVAFEKDMAVINDAIAKLQKEVRKNPKNGAAKQLLFSSYQNKIDLLNSVSERSDLVASIR